MAQVVIADDEPAIRNALSRFLCQAGHDVRCACDGDETLKLLAERATDVLLTDISMPGVSGLNLLEEAAKTYPEVKVILMTGLPSVEGASIAVRRGAFSYQVKPMRPSAVLKAVEQAAEVKTLEESRKILRLSSQHRSREADQVHEQLKSQRRQIRDPLSQMIEASREAGMEEMATRLMHFLGNALTHAATSTGVIGALRPTSAIVALNKIVGHLSDPTGSAESGQDFEARTRAVVPYLRAIAGKLEELDRVLHQELHNIDACIQEVRTLIADQCEGLGRHLIVERCNLTQVVEEWIDRAIGRDSDDLMIERDFDDSADILACRSVLLYVICGILDHCLERLALATANPRRLCVRIAHTNGHQVELVVADNGPRLTHAQRERLFQTNKNLASNGSRTRLHIAALAADRIGATFDTDWEPSDANLGVRFCIRLPMQAEASLDGEAETNGSDEKRAEDKPSLTSDGIDASGFAAVPGSR